MRYLFRVVLMSSKVGVRSYLNRGESIQSQPALRLLWSLTQQVEVDGRPQKVHSHLRSWPYTSIHMVAVQRTYDILQ